MLLHFIFGPSWWRTRVLSRRTEALDKSIIYSPGGTAELGKTQPAITLNKECIVNNSLLKITLFFKYHMNETNNTFQKCFFLTIWVFF